MKIKILFFASLRESLGLSSLEIEVNDQYLTALEVWQIATKENTLKPNIKVAINQLYADLNTRIYDNDEVAFFPPVTGG